MNIPMNMTFRAKDGVLENIVWDGLPDPQAEGRITVGTLDMNDEPLVLVNLNDDETRFGVYLSDKTEVFADDLSEYTCWVAVVQTIIRKLELGHYLEVKD